MKLKIRPLAFAEHSEAMNIASQNSVTKGFSHMMFSGKPMYDNNWIAGAFKGKKLVGFICIRHLVRKAYTSLYYVGVDIDHQRDGVGGQLLNWVWNTSPHKEIRLKCQKDNAVALDFYDRHKFVKMGEDEKHWHLVASRSTLETSSPGSTSATGST